MPAKYGAFANKMTGRAASAAAAATTNVIISLPVDQIDENPLNEQVFSMDGISSLAERMKKKGDTSPIRVRRKEDGRYEVEEGHRRLRAHIKNGDRRIDCILGNEQERADIIDSIVMSNLTTRNLTPLEMAKAMQLWVEESLPAFREKEGLTGKTNEILSEKVGISVRSVARIRSLLKLIPEIHKLLEEGKVEYTAVLPLAQLKEEKQRKVLKGMLTLLDRENEEITATDIGKLIAATDTVKKEDGKPAEKRQGIVGRSEKAVLNLVTWIKKKPITEESVRIIADNIKKEDVDDLKKIRDAIEEIIKVKLQDTGK